ncbi:MAG: SMC-Scp complex subunit ScpB [Phycisphaerae bacterium]|nr:SMC-Scp complex subunit ScpB [Phycisphaerae bacterium]
MDEHINEQETTEQQSDQTTEHEKIASPEKADLRKDNVRIENVPEEEDIAEAIEFEREQISPQETAAEADFEPTLESVIEAILFASDESLTAARISNITDGSTKQISDVVKHLNEKYKTNKNSFRIERIAGGYQMLTLPGYNLWLQKLLRVRSDNKLTAAAMETLAIIAYKQPAIRADVESIRGVASGEMIRSLMYKGLVKIVGRAEVLGRPMLYGTTKKFLETFGLNSLKDMPKIEELKKPRS